MPTNDRTCERKRELLEDLLRALSLAKDADGKAEIPPKHDAAGVSELDSRLAQTFGDQERAISALKKHLEEHGC